MKRDSISLTSSCSSEEPDEDAGLPEPAVTRSKPGARRSPWKRSRSRTEAESSQPPPAALHLHQALQLFFPICSFPSRTSNCFYILLATFKRSSAIDSGLAVCGSLPRRTPLCNKDADEPGCREAARGREERRAEERAEAAVQEEAALLRVNIWTQRGGDKIETSGWRWVEKQQNLCGWRVRLPRAPSGLLPAFNWEQRSERCRTTALIRLLCLHSRRKEPSG